MALTKSQQRQAERHRRYWAEREEEALRHRITDEKEYDREIARIYSDMLASCQTEIDAFYGRYASKEGITLSEAKKRVSQADIAAYERKAARYVKDKDFSAKANEEMRLYNATMRINRLEMLKANIGLELISGHEDLQKFMSKILKGRTIDELRRQGGILGKTITNNAQAAHAIVNGSFKNATFSDRVWLQQDLLKSELDKLLQSGLIQGKNARVLARDLKKKFDTSTFNAERLMRTELARVQTEAQKQSFERNGFTEYTFLANSGCCDLCKDKDGKHFKVADMMPGENAAPLHPFCRCSVAAYSDRKEYDEWLSFLENGGTTEEYNKQKADRLLTNVVKNDKIISFNIGRSVGAAAKKYPVRMAGSRQHLKLAEGQTITGKVFAGKGTRIEIRDRFALAAIYKVPADDIQKLYGKGYVILDGKKVKAELHWYEANGERFDMKIKRFLE